VVLDDFLEWLQRSSIDRRIKDPNKLKRIANEKKENRLSVFQGSNNKKEKSKKNNSEEDGLTYGTQDCDIGNKSSSMKLYLLLMCEN
jgi:hypothetical protein